MSTNWYYVENNERIGPVDNEAIKKFIDDKRLDGDSYVWKKGFEDWQKLKDVDELVILMQTESPAPDTLEVQVTPEKRDIDWNAISYDERIFTIKVGMDRGTDNAVYGPFSLNMIKKLFDENRINGKTYIFTPGMSSWSFLADLPIYKSIFAELPPVIEELERRVDTRRPFVAKMLFHDSSQVYEGICRDISIGGLQVLVSGFPAEIGNIVTINVHPDNTEFHFSAGGRIVRILEGGQGFSLRFENLNTEAKDAINSYVYQQEN